MDSRVVDLIAARPVQATLDRSPAGLLLTMTRDLDADQGWTWEMLTEPGRLVTWSPVVPDRPLTAVGPATSTEATGQPEVACDVLEIDAPHALVHRWGNHQLRWGLVDVGGRTQLGLQETHVDTADAARNAAGWHLCLAVLEGLARGLDVPRVVGQDAMAYGWEDLRDRYGAILAL